MAQKFNPEPQCHEHSGIAGGIKAIRWTLTILIGVLIASIGGLYLQGREGIARTDKVSERLVRVETRQEIIMNSMNIKTKNGG